jgi:pimeloyl-ACP methyl ester carboxylesterase
MIHANFLNGLKSASTRKLAIETFDSGPSAVRSRLESREISKVARLRLVTTDDGLLDWDIGAPSIPGIRKRRRGSTVSASAEDKLVSFERLEPSQIVTMLANQDNKFTPSRGIFVLKNGKLSPARFPKSGRVLLIVHGTFSNGNSLLNGFMGSDKAANAHGSQFIVDASKKYDGILFFNHPTITVSPLVNAIDLNRAIGDSKAQIDIISHSRGGLVTRWWCEAFDADVGRCKNAILVGSPLAGTGLAAPPNIRKTLKLLTNYGNALSAATGAASIALPILGLVNTLLSIITSITSIAASTPIADAIMAMVPGLHGQSRVGNNPELLRLHQSNGSVDRYAAIMANFQCEDPGWQFWKFFSKGKLLDSSADIIFTGANDLVVDSDSMTFLSDQLRIERVFDFETTPVVHHVNYFDQPETTARLRDWLKV